MRVVEKTDRLRLEPLSTNHLLFYIALIAKPDVHRYLSRALEIAADPEGQAQRIIAMSEAQWVDRGIGPYAVFTKNDDRFIGRGGLLHVAHSDETELNYMLDPNSWGRGYASELAEKCLEIGFVRRRLSKIIATTNPANVPSRRVLERFGFVMTGEKALDGGRVVQMHELDRDEWSRRQSA